MKEDFFAEGFGDNSGIKFSEQQQLFFKAKLQVLDPQKKNHIDLGQAIGFLKYSRLPNEKVKRIFDNLKLTNKRTLEYSEMKKIFRAVALVQNKIEPSSINIEANIKTPLPKFDDEESSQQEAQQQRKPEMQKEVSKNANLSAPPKNNQVSSFDGFNAFNQAFDAKPNQNTSTQNASIQKETPKNTTKNIGQQNKVENALAKNMKKFEDYWSKLPTIDGMKIRGDQVKRLFGNSENKKQLYKLWKLCSHSFKDCLSKGELYIFISLMNSSLIPSKLSPEMQFAIQKLDGPYKNKEKNKESAQNLRKSNTGNTFDGFQAQKSHQFDKSQAGQKKNNKNRLSGTHDFDDFANFANPTPKFQNVPQEGRIKSPETRKFGVEGAEKKFQMPSPPPLEIKTPQQIHYIPKQVVQSIYQASARHYLALVNQFIPPLQILSTQNKQYKVQLENINLNLNNTDQALVNTYSKLNEVKTSQDELNNRLTSTCIRMEKIIQKQSELINYLMEMMKSQLTMNNEKVAALTLDAQNMEEQVNQKVRSVQHMVQNRFKIAEHTGRNSIQTIPQNYNQHQQQNSMVSTNYNKKSAEYMMRSKQSMGFKKKQEVKTPSQTESQHRHQQEQGTVSHKIQQSQMTESVPPNMFPQKLRQKLLEQQRLHQNDPNFKMQQSQSQMDESRQNNDDYHWDIGNGHQFNVNGKKEQKFKKTDSQSENEEQQQKKVRIKRQEQYQMEQKKKYLQEQEKNKVLQAQQQAQQQAQLQAQLQAQQQAQLQAQQQAQLQAQQAQLQSQMYNQLQAQQAQQPLDEEGQKIRMKQARLILIINFLNPMSKQDHLQVALRVSLMNQMQLDTAYAQMYNIYLQRIQTQKKEAMKSGQNPVIVSMPTEEQFRTNKISINQ